MLRALTQHSKLRCAAAPSAAIGAASACRPPHTPHRPVPSGPTASAAVECRKRVEAARERHQTRVSEGSQRAVGRGFRVLGAATDLRRRSGSSGQST